MDLKSPALIIAALLAAESVCAQAPEPEISSSSDVGCEALTTRKLISYRDLLRGEYLCGEPPSTCRGPMLEDISGSTWQVYWCPIPAFEAPPTDGLIVRSLEDGSESSVLVFVSGGRIDWVVAADAGQESTPQAQLAFEQLSESALVNIVRRVKASDNK